MYLSKYIFEFKYKKHTIKLISVLHNKRNISSDMLKKIVDESNKQKTCYLLETDYRKNKVEIRKRFGDHTTNQFMNLLLKEEKENNIKKCVKGWDIRQSILTQNNQNHLYSYFYKLPYLSIEKYYYQKLNVRNVENKSIEKKIKNFLQHNYKEVINQYKKKIMYDISFINNIIKNEKNIQNLRIIDIIKKYQTTKNIFDNLSKLLFQSFAIISDLFLLENILSTNINTNYIIFMGEFHFQDTINFINLMKKDNLF